MSDNWSLDSWKRYKISQQPNWPNETKFKGVIEQLIKLPALVFSGETRNLRKELIEVEQGKSFILQAGNCAESFNDCNGPKIHNFLRIMQSMANQIESQTDYSVVKIGRIAGQYGKPRSSDFEEIDGVKIPVFRGVNINSPNPNVEERKPDPQRLVEGYFRSAATLNLIRAFTQGDYFNEIFSKDWLEFLISNNINDSTALFARYKNGISRFFEEKTNKSQQKIYTSHEALFLDYEEVFTRVDTITADYYNTAAHFVWLGDRTRNINGAHCEYLRGIKNPVGIKIGPTAENLEILDIIKKLNPKNEQGKIVLIVRFGIDNIKEKFASMIQMVKDNHLHLSWMLDPMHGNTKVIGTKKTRYFADIVRETEEFIRICNLYDIHPGGIHIEMTSQLVSECIGGEFGVNKDEVEINYETLVDPRLNGAQTMEYISKLVELLKKI